MLFEHWNELRSCYVTFTTFDAAKRSIISILRIDKSIRYIDLKRRR